MFECRFHHVGYLVEDIPAAADELVGRFGYLRESSVIEDPFQTAYVQFMRLPHGTSWLELVSPNGPHSKLNGALSMGSGLHHLCYEVDDIDLACSCDRLDDMLMLSRAMPAVAFGGRRIAWFIDRKHQLVEFVETGTGPFVVGSILESIPRTR